MEQPLARNAHLQNQADQATRRILRAVKAHHASHFFETRGMFYLLDQSEICFKDPGANQADEPGEFSRMRVDAFYENLFFKFLRGAVKLRAKQTAKFVFNGLFHNRMAWCYTIRPGKGLLNSHSARMFNRCLNKITKWA